MRKGEVMRTIQRTCFEVLVIGVIGLALGFAANGVRAKGTISPGKDYFARGTQSTDPKLGAATTVRQGESAANAADHDAGAAARNHTKNGQEPLEGSSAQAAPSGAAPNQIARRGADASVANTSAQESPPASAIGDAAVEQSGAGKHLKHEYQSISFNEVVAVFNDPLTRQGMNLFVDARNDDNFNEGHIPGAVQCFPFEMHLHIDEVLARANGVDKIIVYCNGGDCEDSIFTCRDLIAAGIPSESVYLYEGGWKEWAAKDMPVEKD